MVSTLHFEERRETVLQDQKKGIWSWGNKRCKKRHWIVRFHGVTKEQIIWNWSVEHLGKVIENETGKDCDQVIKHLSKELEFYF